MGLEHVETITASSQSTVDFTNVFGSSDGADRYIIFVDNVLPATDGATLTARMSSDGGSSWDSGASDYAWSTHKTLQSGSTSSTGSSGASEIELNDDGIGNDPTAPDVGMLVLSVHDPTDSNRATVLRSKNSNSASSGAFRCGFAGGERLTQSAIDSVQFLFDSGNISSGIFSVYKVTQSAGSLDHIETQNPSGASSVDFTSVFGSGDGYDRYMIEVDNVIPATDDTSLQARMSSDGGSTWDSGASDYAWSIFNVLENSSTGSVGSSGDSKISDIIRNTGNDPSNNDTARAEIIISDPTDSNRATVIRNSDSMYRNGAAASFQTEYSGGIRLAQSAVDSIRFFMSSGNISSGIFSVYGVGS